MNGYRSSGGNSTIEFYRTYINLKYNTDMDAETFAKWLRVDETFEQTPGIPNARPSAKPSDKNRTPQDITKLHQFARRYMFNQERSKALRLLEQLSQKQYYKTLNKLRPLSSYLWTCQAPDVLLFRICGEILKDPENADTIFLHAKKFVTGKSSDKAKVIDPGTWMDMVKKIGLKDFTTPKMEEFLTQFKLLEQVG